MTVEAFCHHPYAAWYWLSPCQEPPLAPLRGRWAQAFGQLWAEWWSHSTGGGTEAVCGAPSEPELAMVWVGSLRPLGLRPCRGCGVFWPCYSESCSFARSELCFHCTYLLP